MMSFIYSNDLVVAKSSFKLLSCLLSKDTNTHVSLMSFANIFKCVLVFLDWICMCLCGGIDIVVIREAGFG